VKNRPCADAELTEGVLRVLGRADRKVICIGLQLPLRLPRQDSSLSSYFSFLDRTGV
jgi:hypothetical protein